MNMFTKLLETLGNNFWLIIILCLEVILAVWCCALHAVKRKIVPQSFDIALNSYWMNRDTYDVDFMYNTLVYLQIMKSYTPQYTRMVDWWKNETSENMAVHRLSVPQYVQAIDLDWSEKLEVDYLEVPDTVLAGIAALPFHDLPFHRLPEP